MFIIKFFNRLFKKEEEEAMLTKAYEQFREAFEDSPSTAGGKSFIRGAVVNANKVVEGINCKKF